MLFEGVGSLPPGAVKVFSDPFVPEFENRPLTGWRAFLVKRLRFPERWFKHEKDRCFWEMFGTAIVCHPNNYHILERALIDEIEKRRVEESAARRVIHGVYLHEDTGHAAGSVRQDNEVPPT